VREELIVKRIETFLRKNDYSTIIEVPNMGQSVDIVAQKGRWLSFIEVKLSNWSRALIQSQRHELVADFIIIAVASKSVSMGLMIAAEEKGYGVIHFNRESNRCTIAIKPRLNKKSWPPQKRILLEKLNKIKKNGH